MIINSENEQFKYCISPDILSGQISLYEKGKGYLYTGDLIYIGDLFAYFQSTDLIAYMNSIKKLALLSVNKILPAHHDLNVPLSICLLFPHNAIP